MYVLGPKRPRGNPLDRLFSELERELSQGVNRGRDVLRELSVPLMGDPEANLLERENEYVLSLAVPGLTKGDLEVSVKGRNLTISRDQAEDKIEEGEKYRFREWNYNSFSRSFLLPRDTDVSGIEAHCENGILTLALPRKEEEGALTISVE